MKTWVIVFYMLMQGPSEHVARMPNVTFSSYPRWERVEFPHEQFSSHQGCQGGLNTLRVQPPANVASVIRCELAR